jgi:hypothetical protein
MTIALGRNHVFRDHAIVGYSHTARRDTPDQNQSCYK